MDRDAAARVAAAEAAVRALRDELAATRRAVEEGSDAVGAALRARQAEESHVVGYLQAVADEHKAENEVLRRQLQDLRREQQEQAMAGADGATAAAVRRDALALEELQRQHRDLQVGHTRSLPHPLCSASLAHP